MPQSEIKNESKRSRLMGLRIEFCSDGSSLQPEQKISASEKIRNAAAVLQIRDQR